MPQAIPIIASAVTYSVGASALVQAAWTIGTSLVVGLYEQDQAKRKAKDAYNASLEDRLVTVQSGVAARSYVLGTVRTSGTLMHVDSIGTNKTTLDTVIAYAANRCELVGYFLDDDYIAIADFPGTKFGKRQVLDVQETFTVTGPTATVSLTSAPRSAGDVTAIWRQPGKGAAAVTLGSGSSITLSSLPATTLDVTVSYKTNSGEKIRCLFKDGDPDQLAATFGDVTSPLWTSDHRLRGICHSRMLNLWDEDIYADGAPALGALIKGGAAPGHPFFDPRDSSYPAYTDNPAILAGWWMTLPRRLGGMGFASDWIDWESIAAAANICDETILVRTLDGSSYEYIKRYQCHTMLSTDDPPLENLKIILGAMAGKRVFTAGKYRVLAGAFRSASLTLTDADLVGDKAISVSTSAGIDAAPNVVTARFSNAAKNWVESSPKAVTNQDYIDADGHEEPLDVSLPASTDERQANYLMGVALESSRPAFGLTVTVGSIGEDIALTDTLQLSITNREAYAEKTFEVVGIKELDGGTFSLELTQIRPQTWALDADRFTPSDPVPVSDVSFLWQVTPPTGFTAQLLTPQTLPDGTSLVRIELTWDTPVQEYVREGGSHELRYRRSDGEWIGITSVAGDATMTTVTAALSDQDFYQFQVRAVNGIGARSEWVDAWVQVDGVPLENVFVARGNCVVGSSNILKYGGSAGWDSDVYSIRSYQNCHVYFKPNDAVGRFAIGLGTNPLADQDYGSINYAWICNYTSGVQIFEAGSFVGSYGGYDATTVLAVTYDGATVTYWKNGVSVRTVSIAGLTLYLDSSFEDPGAGCNSLLWGPTTNLAVTDTGQISSEAVCEVIDAEISPQSLTSGVFRGLMDFLSVGPYPVDTRITIRMSSAASLGAGSAGHTLSILGRITDSAGWNGGFPPMTSDDSLLNVRAAYAGVNEFSVFMQRTFVLPANTTEDYHVTVFPSVTAASLMNQTYVNLEAVKR